MRIAIGLLAALATAPAAGAAVPPDAPLAAKVYRHPDLDFRQVLQGIGGLPPALAARAEEDAAALGAGPGLAFYDPRAQVLASLIVSVPVIPGAGQGNELAWPAGGAPASDAGLGAAAWKAVLGHLHRRAAALRIDAAELGTPRVGVHEDATLLQLVAPRVIFGVPVRDSSLTAIVKHGNLVLLGLENWGEPTPLAGPPIAADEARRVVLLHVAPHGVEGIGGGRQEYVPMARGDRLELRRVWVLPVTMRGDHGSWEALVDAAGGELIAFEDKNAYASRHAFGGVYPVSNDQRPPDGVEQAAWPLPFLKLTTGAGPMTTNSSGAFACASGNAWTGLGGARARITDGCGAVSESSAAGDLDLGFGPTPGATDCVVPAGHSAGDTKAARTAFFHATRANEQAAGYLPTNAWLATPIDVNTNISGSCNAFWTGNSINFYREVSGACRSTGENPGVVVHEWGHGLDANGVNPNLAQPFEGIADVHSFLRLGLSCIGRGVFTNMVCAGYGDPCVGDPTTGCTGRRDIDFAGHACGRPHTITWVQSGFPAGHCTDGLPRPACPTGTPGPCGRLVHCESHVVSETAFDLARRDLPAAGLDPTTAHELTTRLFILGSQAVTAWYTCAVGGGCAATGGYLQLLAADDDDGNLANGTPHMTAIRSAFERHQIHCATPTPLDAGCSGGPTAAPALAAAGGPERVDLSWTAVPNAAQYFVYRNDDVAGCDLGRIKIAEVTGTSYADLDLPGGHAYSYAVIPVGANTACFGRSSNCVSATASAEPCATTADFALSCNPSSVPVSPGGTSTTTCRVTSANGFSAPVGLSCANLPPSVTCAYDPGSVTPPPNGAAWSTVTVTAGGSAPPGSYSLQALGTSGALTRSVTISLGVGSVAVAPHALAVDADGNGVFEPGEAAVMTPTWRNIGQTAVTPTGRVSSFTGPAGALYAIVGFATTYGTMAPGAQATCGGYSLGISGARPVTHWDATIHESLGPPPLVASMDWTLHVGASFTDVPASSPFYPFIETILHRNVTGGCTGTTYCPAAGTTREQMAVFVLVAREPPGYAPPACVAGSEQFADVPASSPFCRWIEELARRGVVSGCAPGSYCPTAPASREAMAVFVLRTLDPTLDPPACGTPLFADVPASSPFCRWIEELARRGIVTGCGGGNYCPTADVSREQMSVFLAVTFGLTLYGL